MKNKINLDITKTFPLLVHTKMSTFAWGKVVIDYAYIVAKKMGMKVMIMHSWQEVVKWGECKVIPVMGVDIEWLEEVVINLTAHNFKILQMSGRVGTSDIGISKVGGDQRWVTKKSIEFMKEHGRTRIALFGIQSNDTSDVSKADCFSQIISKEDVFYYLDDINVCFKQFLLRIDQYDSVICANDIVAVYLMSCCREHGIAIPDRLYLIGNSDLWISSHVSPTLSTVAYNPENLVIAVINAWKMLITFSDINTVDINLEGDFIERESSGGMDFAAPAEGYSYNYYKYDDNFLNNELYTLCPEIKKIKNLDNVLSSRTTYEMTILQRLSQGWSYEAIAAEIFLSVDTVKYHIKKLYRLLGVRKRQELIELLEKYGIRLM